MFDWPLTPPTQVTLLVSLVLAIFAALVHWVPLVIAIACWAMVHGLATLILEGSLARKLGVSKARQRQVADEVIGTLTHLLSNNSK